MGNNVFFRKKLFYTKISLCFQNGFLLYEKNYKKKQDIIFLREIIAL